MYQSERALDPGAFLKFAGLPFHGGHHAKTVENAGAELGANLPDEIGPRHQ